MMLLGILIKWHNKEKHIWCKFKFQAVAAQQERADASEKGEAGASVPQEGVQPEPEEHQLQPLGENWGGRRGVRRVRRRQIHFPLRAGVRGQEGHAALQRALRRLRNDQKHAGLRDAARQLHLLRARQRFPQPLGLPAQKNSDQQD
jgi:hypothetical protein